MRNKVPISHLDGLQHEEEKNIKIYASQYIIPSQTVSGREFGIRL